MDNFMNEWLSLLLNSFSSIFSSLDRFTFFGITLLDFLIACFVLSVAVPIVIATANGYINSSTVSDTARGAVVRTGKGVRYIKSARDSLNEGFGDWSFGT